MKIPFVLQTNTILISYTCRSAIHIIGIISSTTDRVQSLSIISIKMFFIANEHIKILDFSYSSELAIFVQREFLLVAKIEL